MFHVKHVAALHLVGLKYLMSMLYPHRSLVCNDSVQSVTEQTALIWPKFAHTNKRSQNGYWTK